MFQGRCCYLCGKGINVKDFSEDHVPMRSIFLHKPIPEIKLPSHKGCNNKYKLDEEFFLRLLVATTAYWNDVATKVWKEKTLPSIKHPKSKEFLEKLLENIVDLDKLYKGEFPEPIKKLKAISINVKRSDNVLIKISRGLFFYHFKKRIEECLGERFSYIIHFKRLMGFEGLRGRVYKIYSVNKNDPEFQYTLLKKSSFLKKDSIIFNFLFYNTYSMEIEIKNTWLGILKIFYKRL